MDSKCSTRNLIVERRYEEQDEACSKAITVLLKSAVVARTSDDGTNASKEIKKNVRDATRRIFR